MPRGIIFSEIMAGPSALGETQSESGYDTGGHQRARDNRGFDLWSDTTPLHTTLHDGDSKDVAVEVFPQFQQKHSAAGPKLAVG